MRYLLYGDLHASTERLTDSLAVLRHIRKQRHSYDVVVNLGDTFHNRGLIRTEVFDAVMVEWRHWHNEGIKQVVIIGNHDQADKLGVIHPFRLLFDDWIVVDKPQRLPWDDILCAPYMDAGYEELIGGCKEKYAFCHWPVCGANVGQGRLSPTGVSVDALKQFKLVLSGHYHERQKLENFWYIGAVSQQNFGDSNSQRGYAIWEPGKELVFYEIPGLSRYWTVNIVDESFVMPKIDANDHVRVRITGAKDVVNRIADSEQIKSIKAKSVVKEFYRTDHAIERLKVDLDDREALINEYIGQVKTGLDTKKLLDVGLSLYRGDEV